MYGKLEKPTTRALARYDRASNFINLPVPAKSNSLRIPSVTSTREIAESEQGPPLRGNNPFVRSSFTLPELFLSNAVILYIIYTTMFAQAKTRDMNHKNTHSLSHTSRRGRKMTRKNPQIPPPWPRQRQQPSYDDLYPHMSNKPNPTNKIPFPMNLIPQPTSHAFETQNGNQTTRNSTYKINSKPTIQSPCPFLP